MQLANRKISIWGDSILKGIILDEFQSRYVVLKNNCVDRFAQETNAIITNHASFGMTTVKAFERITRSLERRPPAAQDIILVEFGGNDCDYHWAEISEQPDKKHLPNTPIDKFAEVLQSIIEAFKSFSIDPILMTLPPLEPTRYFNWISKGLSKENILKWLGDVNKIYRWQEAYNEIIVDTAQTQGLRLINTRNKFLTADHFADRLCADGIHLNEAGHDTLLDSFLGYVHSL
jgi:lysophospholipase L1-like esterase